MYKHLYLIALSNYRLEIQFLDIQVMVRKDYHKKIVPITYRTSISYYDAETENVTSTSFLMLIVTDELF